MSSGIAEKHGFSSPRLARITAHMRRYVDKGILPGIASLVSRNGEIVHQSAVGWADVAARKPLGADAIYRIYSMSKPITVAALLTLFEEGRFQLDDEAARYLPELGRMQVLRGMDGGRPVLSPPSRPMTVRHLLTHTAGLTYGMFGDDTEPGERMYAESGLLQVDRTLEEMMPLMAELPLLFDPGERWNYSVSIDVLGRLIEVLSGEPFDAFLRERVFEPLGMADTGFWVSEDSARLATLYSTAPDGRLTPIESPGGPYDAPRALLSGGGGLVSTIGDYWRFGQMLVNGGVLNGVRVLAPGTIRLMGSNHLPAHIRYYGSPPHVGYGFGLGVRVLRNPVAAGELCSAGSFGWSGLATTNAWVDPAAGIVGVIMMQYISPPETTIPTEIEFRNLTYQALTD